MAKQKKAGKNRMNKNTMALLLEEYFKSNPNRTISFKDIFRELKLNTHPLKMLAIEVMEEMAWDDFLTRVSLNAYRLHTCDTQLEEGIFIRKRNGRNSFQPFGGGNTVLVTERNSLFALDGDTVRVCYMARRRNHAKEAQVVEIIKRCKDVFVGRLRITDDMAFLIPVDTYLATDILVPLKKVGGARPDEKVVVRVTRWPDASNKCIMGEVIDILGKSGDNDAEMNTILVQYGLPYSYPKEVEDAANKITGEITAEDLAEREDYRDVYTCTIDPHDAKDFDDALSLKQIDSSEDNPLWEVGVHIADVSHYVKEGDIIDQEAQRRATSIYLVDRTIPMLPERLCNFVCSLRPNEEKLAYSVIFKMDKDANVLGYRVVHTVIKSNHRYTYEEAQEELVGTDMPTEMNVETGSYPAVIKRLWEFASLLRERRFKHGSVNFEKEEMKFEIDEAGKPLRCYFRHSFEAHHLVEEFMLLANRTVAEHVGKKTLPYRVHDNPDPQKLEQLRAFTMKFGYKMKSTTTKTETARALNSMMAEFNGRGEAKLIQLLALRSMMKAKYTVHNIGHFGLAFDKYTHFTSPIRRYPDTMVHRLLTYYAKGGHSANAEKYEELCKHSSEMEQIASSAERDSIKYKCVEFMKEHIGEEYDAHISGITSHGIYCEIDENHCEGMLPLSDLNDDYYEFDEKNYCLRGRRRNNVYQLGDAIRIKVAAANLEKKQLDFGLINK